MRRAVLVLVIAALGGAHAASAHVTVQPDLVRRDATRTVVFTVPNERPSGRIVSFDVELPAGVTAVGRAPNWRGLDIAPEQTRRFRLALLFRTRNGSVQLVANERFADGTTDSFYPVVTVTGAGLSSDVKLALAAGAALLALLVAIFFVALVRWLRS